MKVLLFLPFAPDSPTGNAVTARRIRKHLAPLGVEVVLQHLPADARFVDVLSAIDRERPDVLQWYNAWKTGRWLPQAKQARGLPSVITLTGTDINREAEDPARREAVLAALRGAEAIVTYSAPLRDHAVKVLPEVSPRIHEIPKGVELGTARFELPSWAAGDVVLFFLPAGVRPEKNNRFAVRALDAVHAADPRVRLLFAGPILDSEYGEALRQDLSTRPWAGHIENIPHDAMASVYAQAAVVLNTSLSEGLANAVIEAMACGRPVLASDIEGNRQVVTDGETGLLYRDEADFVTKARRLVSDAALRERLGASAQATATGRFSFRAEAESLGRVLHRIDCEHRWAVDLILDDLYEFEARIGLEGAYDPRAPEPEPPSFGGGGRILEARSDRVHADHAAYLLGDVIARDPVGVAGKLVWEVGCGSGVLAALCGKLGAREVWATDVDDEAVSLAAETARLNGVRVQVAQASLMDFREDLRPEAVVANLPQKPVPPGLALPVANDGGPDGTRLVAAFLEQAARRMPSGARLYLFQHSLATEEPVRTLLDRAFHVCYLETRLRIFYEDEFPQLLPYWLQRREGGLCTFDDLGPGRYAFLCAAVTCVRR